MGLFTKTPVPAAPKPIAPADAAAIAAPPGDAAPAATPAMTLQPPTRTSMVQPAAPTERQLHFQQLKVRIHQQLVERLDVQNLRTLPPEIVRKEVRVLIRDLCQNEKGLINSTEQEKLMDEVMDETFGLGPLEVLLKDPTISDILVNRWDRIYCERRGRLEVADSGFRDNAHLRQIIDRIVGLVGRRIDETSPMVDARLTDGSRVNAIIPPLALDGPAMSIRRFGSKPLQLEDLIRHGAFPAAVWKEARAPLRVSAARVNCGTRSSPPSMSVRLRFMRPSSSAKTRYDSSRSSRRTTCGCWSCNSAATSIVMTRSSAGM